MLIETEGTAFRHVRGDAEVLRDLSIRVPSGAMTCVIGPSGSGKSTLLDLLGGLRRPTRGRILLDRSSATPAELRAIASWVVQSNPMLAGRTAVANAALGRLALGDSQRQAYRCAAAALADFGLGARTGAKISELSGGEIQRVAIVRCLLSDAPVVLADEPTGQLDAATTDAVADAFSLAARRGKTVVVATHDPLVAARADTVIDLRAAEPR